MPPTATPVLSLAGAWRLRDAAGGDPIEAPVPGDVHSALFAAGRIPDPYFGENEKDVQWVGEREWIYERTFDCPEELLARPSVALDVEHPDTFCTLRINGQVAGETANRFRRYRFEVKPLLVPGRNTITATFRSAEQVARERGAALAHPVPHIFDADGVGPAKRHFNLIRKPQCHGGWDWGISLMQIGLPGVVRLVACAEARIDAWWCEQRHEPGRCTLAVTIEAFAPVAGRRTLRLAVDGRSVGREVELAAGANRVQAEIAVADPRLWWPNGYGEQPLYELAAELGDAHASKRIGLRTLAVLNRPDQWGTSLSVRVNGVDIFAKGANWIPADALSGRQTPRRIAHLLASAQAAHMTMIRVWGGGQFEADAFYEECDRRGLLIWHDLMFACALYPADRAFLAEVRAEVEHQLKRLRDHPSIALWCGDNEVVGALRWFPESTADRDRYLIDYDRLSRALAETVEAHDPARMFWPSSPCAGPGDFRDCWHDDGHGDMHAWAVWHEGRDFEHYRSLKPRFCSEFGFQSFSSPAVARTFCDPDQLNPTAPQFEHHQKNRGGNARILETMARYFRMPQGVEDTLYLSQLQQALAIKTAVEGWRRLRPRCMGTLYWQLNDVWPVASWSSLEYTGKWKQLHYHARRFFAPLAVAAVPADGDPDTLEVWAVNDHPHPAAVAVAVDLLGLDGTAIDSLPLAADLEPGSARRLGAWPVARFCPRDGDRTTRFLDLRLAGTVAGRRESHRNQHVFARYKALRLPVATVVPAVAALPDGRLRVQLATDFPALWTWLDAGAIAGEFDDNSLALLPGRPLELTFAPERPQAAADLAAALTVKHLRQTYR